MAYLHIDITSAFSNLGGIDNLSVEIAAIRQLK